MDAANGLHAGRDLFCDDGGDLGRDENREAASQKRSLDSSYRRSLRPDDRPLVRAVLAAYVVEHRYGVLIISRLRYLEALSHSKARGSGIRPGNNGRRSRRRRVCFDCELGFDLCVSAAVPGSWLTMDRKMTIH